MSTKDKQKKEMLFLFLLAYPMVVWMALKTAPYFSDGLFGSIKNSSQIFSDPLHFTICDDSFRAVFLFTLIYSLIYCTIFTGMKNYRRNEEHGSASWGNINATKKKYQAKNSFENKILTQHVRISLNTRKHKRNLNTLVIGGSGAGKTRFYAKPNLMQANTSFVVLDPKGELLASAGYLLSEQGYDIKILDLINMDKSFCYNPFVYIKNDNDVMRLVTNIIRNTTPKSSTSSDPFWEKSEIALLEALMFYLIYEAPPEEQNFGMVMDMLLSAQVKEDDEDYESPLDVLFSRLEITQPDHIALKQYHIFKLAAGKTAKSILVSLGVRLEKLNLDSLRAVLSYDEMGFEMIGEKKTALFAIIPDNDSSFNFLIGMLYTQLFQILYHKADSSEDKRLKIPVHFLMDEFANVALPDEFDKLLSTMRSREIFVSIIIQNLAQLKALYEKQWESIVGNCDQLLYLGGNEQSTHEYISKLLGKETIDTNTYGLTRGRNGSYSINYQQSGRELLTPDEVRLIDNDHALLFIRGERPIQDQKYDLLKHKAVRQTSDGGKELYRHGEMVYEIDFNEIKLKEDAEYELFSEEELEEIYL